MTAEVALLNGNAIALAADSAVTVGSQKIYNSAAKVFELSKFQPIAAMIYGNAVLQNVPWETILKQYRHHLHDKKFSSVLDYANDVIDFLKRNIKYFPLDEQVGWAENRIRLLYRNIYDDFEGRCESYLEGSSSEGLDEETVVDILSQSIQNMISSFEGESYVLQKSSVPVAKKISGALAGAIGPELFGDLYKIVHKKLERLTFLVLTKSLLRQETSGIVLAGFGTDQIFPSLISYEIDGVLADSIRLEKGLERTIKNAADAAIIPFAQRDMVSTFMEGVNPKFMSFFKDCLVGIFSDLADSMSQQFSNPSKYDDFKDKFTTIAAHLINKIEESAEEHRQRYHVQPILEIVRVLPKDELAGMAEALVNLTALKRRVTRALETVGGPVDVCVISKGDGLVWVKHKSYFDRKINGHHRNNYWRLP